jgi:L-asparaginase II
MTNSRSEARARAQLTEAADNAGAFDPGTAVVSYDDALRLMLAFTEPAAAMPKRAAVEALSTLYGILSGADGDNAWSALQEAQMLITNTLALLSPSHSGETGEVERRMVALIQKIAAADPRGGIMYPDEVAGEWEAEARSIAAALTPNDGGRDDV